MKTHIQGIPCRAVITHYTPGKPMRVTGKGFGDAEPPEPEELEFAILDMRGYAAPWLERKMRPADIARIEQELMNQESEDE